MTAEPAIKPIPSNAADFAYEFVSRLRKEPDIKTNPSLRQTQAVARILSARYFRNGKLTLDDFVDAAVVTTYPPDQPLARRLAEDILLGRENNKANAPEVEAAVVVSDAGSAVQKVIDQIRREQELAKIIDKDRVETGYKYLQELRSRKDAKEMYRAAVGKKEDNPYLTEGDVVLRGISSDEELKQVAGSELMSRSGNLAAQDIANSKHLDVLDSLAETANAAERLAARALRGDPDVLDQFTDLAQRDPATAAKALHFMEQLGVPDAQTLQEMDDRLQDALKDLSDAAAYAGALHRLPRNMGGLTVQAPGQYDLGDAMELGRSIASHTDTDITKDLLDQYDKQYDSGASSKVDLNQLAENAQNLDSWKSLVRKLNRDMIEGAKARSNPADYLRHTIEEMAKLASSLPDSQTSDEWQQAMQRAADAAVSHTKSKSHLRRTVRDVSRSGVPPSKQAVEEAGKRLGMTEEEILELINPTFQVIKKLVQQGTKNFERLHSLMASANLTHEQLRETADIAAKDGNQDALGAVAHIDLHAALGTRGQGMRGYGARYGQFEPGQQTPDPSRVDMALGGLLGGPATNVVKIWYTYRDELPDDVNGKLRDIARKLLVDLGSRFAKSTMGSSMLGGIQESTTVRPFRIGDETDLISLEETIDHLLSQGRTSFEIVNTEDFLMVETYQGHRAFFWALDKSGSMDAAEKLGMLAISVMAGIFGVQKDDFGVVLFDSETHVVKEVTDKNVSVEKVAADLLDVRAGGGTGGRTSMSLALDNFKMTRAKERIFIMSTDMYLSDLPQCVDLARQMKQLDIKMIILVPKSEYAPEAAQELAKAAHGTVVPVGSIDELPESLLRLTNY